MQLSEGEGGLSFIVCFIFVARRKMVGNLALILWRRHLISVEDAPWLPYQQARLFGDAARGCGCQWEGAVGSLAARPACRTVWGSPGIDEVLRDRPLVMGDALRLVHPFMGEVHFGMCMKDRVVCVRREVSKAPEGGLDIGILCWPPYARPDGGGCCPSHSHRFHISSYHVEECWNGIIPSANKYCRNLLPDTFLFASKAARRCPCCLQ